MTVLFVLICALLSFALAGAEAAVLSVSRVRVRHAAAEGDARARLLLPLLEDRDAMLGAVTVSNHLTNLGGFLVLTWELVRALGASGYAVAFLLALPFFLIGLEIIPKKLFRRYPFRSLRVTLPLLKIVGWARPLFRLGVLIRRRAEEKPEPLAGSGEVPREDLRTLSAAMVGRHVMSATAAELIGRVLDYRRLMVRDLMVPLSRSMALAPDVPVRLAQELARSNSLVAVPVLGEGGDYIGVFEPANCGGQVPPDRMVRQHMRSLEQVGQDEQALRALQRLRKKGRTVALVVRTGREPVGVVTEEALLRPLLSLEPK